jgi:hypothetical protein
MQFVFEDMKSLVKVAIRCHVSSWSHCGDGLQTEENIFWDCKLYEDQRATMVDISQLQSS